MLYGSKDHYFILLPGYILYRKPVGHGITPKYPTHPTVLRLELGLGLGLGLGFGLRLG